MRSTSRLASLLVMLFAAITYPAHCSAAEQDGRSFTERCRGPQVLLCLPLDSEEEIAKLRSTPGHLDLSTRIQLDPKVGAARFTVPPRSPADSSGQLHIDFPRPLVGLYVAFDVRFSAGFLRHQYLGGGGWKFFILGQGREGCAPFEIVGGNGYYKGFPSFYFKCAGSQGVNVHDPFGDNKSQFDYQPGGDTACLRHPKTGTKPCALFEADTWTTFQIHINALASYLEVWQTIKGKTLKIIDFPLAGMPMPPPPYEWLKLTPYNTGKTSTEVHPAHHLWYRRVIVSTRIIPSPLPD